MKAKEEQIISQIEIVNDMLEVINKELMELLGETIDNYDMQLLGHKIIVTVTKHLEGE